MERVEAPRSGRLIEAFRDPAFVQGFNMDLEIKGFCNRHEIPALDLGGCLVFAHVLQWIETSGEIYGIGDIEWGCGHCLLKLGDEYVDCRGIHSEEAVINRTMNAGYVERAILKPIDEWTIEELAGIWNCEDSANHLHRITNRLISEYRERENQSILQPREAWAGDAGVRPTRSELRV